MTFQLPFNVRTLPEKAVQFEIDSSEVTDIINSLENQIPEILARIGERSNLIARELLGQVFTEAMDRLSYDQFAPEFRDKLLENLQKLPVETIVTRQGGSVEFDLDALGNKADLERAFHRHAVLKGGGKLTEPFAGQEFAVSDPDVRHEFFEAMLHGEPFQGRDGHIIQTTGLWERTKAEYLEIWGDKSPQWLYLEFGQSRFDPKIPAYAVIETLQDDLGAVVNLIFEQEFDAAFKIANTARQITTKQNRLVLQAPAGGITIRGTKYGGGQFVGPRAGFR